MAKSYVIPSLWAQPFGDSFKNKPPVSIMCNHLAVADHNKHRFFGHNSFFLNHVNEMMHLSSLFEFALSLFILKMKL